MHWLKACSRHLIVLILVLGSCRSVPSSGQSLEMLLQKELGLDYSIQYNSSRTMVLGVQQPDNDHLLKRFKYVVVDVSTKRILENGSVQAGTVKWHSDDALEVETSAQGNDQVKRTIVNIRSH
jgi:hypothetical protein